MARFKFYTLWLSLVCIGVFIMQNIFPSVTDNFLLNQDSWVQPYRFITSIFLHATVIHLVFNLFALILFGLILESVIGSRKFLFVFFVSGIIANLVAVNFYSASLGASGAIYGILGCLTLLRPKMVVWAFSLPMPMFVAAILWVAGSVLGIFMPSNVGDIAHLSGIVVGFLVGFYIRNQFRETGGKKESISIPDNYVRDWEERYMK